MTDSNVVYLEDAKIQRFPFLVRIQQRLLERWREADLIFDEEICSKLPDEGEGQKLKIRFAWHLSASESLLEYLRKLKTEISANLFESYFKEGMELRLKIHEYLDRTRQS